MTQTATDEPHWNPSTSRKL